jgi:PAS domain-containing protein
MDVKIDTQNTILEVEHLRKKLHSVTENKNNLITHKQQLDAIMDNAPLEMSLKDREGRFIRVNKKFEALF